MLAQDSVAPRGRLRGLLLGTLVGDSLGLPREGLSPERAVKLFGGRPLTHRLFLRRGMGSDDTDHACMTAQAILRSPDDAEGFVESLGWRLRGWFISLPPGVGWATVRACARLLVGFSPRRSGVNSAGNGPAMRAPIIGACFARDRARLESFTASSTRATHRQPLALDGALAIALASAAGMRDGAAVRPGEVLSEIRTAMTTAEMRAQVALVEEALAAGASAREFAEGRGLSSGVTGFVLHTVPVVLFCWLRYLGEFRRTVEETILLGGDADTTGAIVGALAGVSSGEYAIPTDWLDGILDAPRSVGWLRALGDRVAEQVGADGAASAQLLPLPLMWPLLPLRNLLQLVIVLAHGFRRLLPPW